MATAADHYDHLLAEHYTWMLGGDIDAAAATQANLLKGLGLEVRAEDGAVAVDLGCGPGPQTLALVHLGYGSVTAVDTSASLLQELDEHARHSGVTHAVRPSTRTSAASCPDPHPRLGRDDRLHGRHSAPPSDPRRRGAADHRRCRGAAAGRSFVVTYRDLTDARHGTDRFIPVRHTADRILTCFLDYVDESTVTVYDLLHTRHDGAWQLKTSSYPKLRLPHQWLADQCHAADLVVRHVETNERGLQLLHAVKR
ncbi:class I SAM-dependent methyltransferase [Prescottella defluvii]|nr:class I SAM-dependent methyltransferase [Prescottella defluvii]